MSEDQEVAGAGPEALAIQHDSADAMVWSLLAAMPPMSETTRRVVLEHEEMRAREQQLIIAALGMSPADIGALEPDAYRIALSMAQARNAFGKMADAMAPVVEQLGIELARIVFPYLERLRPMISGMDWGLLVESTLERRARKDAQRERRKMFMARGKHGLKRPNGKRNVSRN